MQKFLIRFFAFFGLVLGGVLAVPAAAEAATLYWVGDDGANTSVATNWKTTDPASCGGGDSLAAPGATDTVIFDADCDNGANINANLSTGDITFQSGYTGTVTQATGVTITTGLGNWDHQGGTFTGGNSSVNTVNLTISGGVFTSTTGTLGIQGNLSRTSGTFTANGGTVSFGGSVGQTITGETFFNLTIANIAASPGDGTDVDPSAAVTVTNTLNVSDGQFQPHTGSDFAAVTIGVDGILKPDASAVITVSGNWTRASGGTFTANTGTVTFDGTSQTLMGATTFYNLSKTEGANDSTDETLTFQVTTTFTITNTLTLDGRDADDRINLVSTNPGTIYSIDVTGGDQSVDFLDVTDSQASTNNITCTNCVNGGGNDDAEAVPHWIFVSGIDLSGTVYSNEGSTALGSMTVRLAINGTDNTTVESNASTGAYSFTSISASAGDVLTFYLEDETQDAVTVTVSDGANLTGIDLYQDRLITRHDNSGSLTNSNLSTAAVSSETDISNIYSVSGGALTVASGKELFVWTGDTFAPGAGVTADDIDINGTFTMGSNAVSLSGTWDATGGAFTSSGTVTFTSGSSEDIISDGDSFNNLTLNGSGGTFEVEDTLDVDGNLTISAGTLDVKSGEDNGITLAGNWDNSGGGFTERSGTVTFNGSGAQTLTGETFYNLTINNSAGSPNDSTDVDSSVAVTVSNTLTVTDGQFQPTTASDFKDISIGAAGILKPDPSATLTVSGNWTNSGTFTANTSTINFDGTSQTLAGSSTFYNLSKTEGSDDSTDETLTITASTTQTITNTLTLDGRDTNDRINLVSSSGGTKFTLDVTGGAVSVDYLDVTDSQASTNNITCTDCVNGGGNDDGEAVPHWIFTTSNTAPVASSIRSIAQATDGSGEVTFKVDIRDTDGNQTQAKIEYSLDESNWNDLTLGAVQASEGDVAVDNGVTYQIQSIDTDTGSDNKVTLTIIWKSQEQIEGAEDRVYLRVTPYDGTEEGAATVSELFAVDNQAPEVSGLANLSATDSSLTFEWIVGSPENNFSAYALCYSTTASEVTDCTGSAKQWTTSQDSRLDQFTTTQTTITGLLADTTYAVRLTATDTLGNVTTLTLTGSRTDPAPVLESDCGPGFIKVGGVCLAQGGGGGAGGGVIQPSTSADEPSVDEPTTEPVIEPAEIGVLPTPALPAPPTVPLSERLQQFFNRLPTNQTLTNALTAASAAAVTASLGVVSSLPTLLSNFLYWLERLGTGLIGLAGSRRRRPWGRVVDAATNNPLPQTIVRILDRQTQQVRDTAVTDAKGEFASLLPPGQYRLGVAKPGWEIEPATTSLIGRLAHEEVYDGNVVEIKQEQLVSVVVAMRPAAGAAPTRLAFHTWLQHLESWLQALSWPLLGVGSVLSAVAVLKDANTLNIVIVAMYAVLITAKYAFARRLVQTLGHVKNAATGEALPSAFVQLFDAATGRQVAAKVTSATGQFVFLPPPGVYTVIASHPGYEPYREAHVVVHSEQDRVVAMTMSLTPKAPQAMAMTGLTG